MLQITLILFVLQFRLLILLATLVLFCALAFMLLSTRKFLPELEASFPFVPASLFWVESQLNALAE